MNEKVFINGKKMKAGVSFGREISEVEFNNKKKRKEWLDEDNWEVKE